jgi:hypothetical protein
VPHGAQQVASGQRHRTICELDNMLTVTDCQWLHALGLEPAAMHCSADIPCTEPCQAVGELAAAAAEHVGISEARWQQQVCLL